MIKTVDLTKKYGEMFAIQAINLDLAAGDLFGFIGPNGAGKTTTMRILATLLEQSWGDAFVCGHSTAGDPREIRRLVGYMPDFFGVYDDMTVIEYLEFFAAAYRINGDRRRQVCEDKLDVVDLAFKRDAYANTLSRGQTQRLGLARVLLHDPQVLLLDEPLSGLDPRARIEMRAVLRRLGQQGKTIMVSSHILPELADICNKVGIIDRGVMTESGTVDEIMQKVRPQVVLLVETTAGGEAAAKVLQSSSLIDKIEVRNGQAVVTLKPGTTDYTELPTALIEAGQRIKMFREEEINLETAFMMLTKGLGKRV